MVLLTILSDAYHGLFPPHRRGVQLERYYYTSNNLFEQSLDIYRPMTSEGTAATKQQSSTTTSPIVALVVGSAWLGHRSILYSGTSWWNSSGPKTVAELGYVCVCIRHRGSFMKSLSLLTMVYIFIMVALLMSLAHVILDDRTWTSLEDVLALGYKEVFLLVSTAGLFLIELAGVGAASFDDMQNDVLDALAWLHANESRLDLVRSRSSLTQIQKDATTYQRRPFVFGGYSSGGHVAATVVQNSIMWTSRDLPEPHIHCDSMLYISPVLSTKPYYHDESPCSKKISLSSSSSSSSSLPSLSSSDAESTSVLVVDPQSLQPLNNEEVSPTTLSKSPPPPTWLTDQVVRAVFGHHVAHKIPSPLHTHDKSPRISHTFLGCKYEMFGLNWLDIFFSSPKYSELLNRMGIASRYVSIESDHWNILSSSELRNVLRKELERIEQECLMSN